MNFNVYCCDGQYLIVDVGITFADDSTPPGIDVICPDLSALRSVRDQIVGIVITHAHEDHVGALHYLWNQLKAPVYCTPFTASVARRKLGEAGLLDQVPLHEVLPRFFARIRWLPIRVGDSHSFDSRAQCACHTSCGSNGLPHG